MTTLNDLTTDIALDVDDDQNEYGAQITSAVLAAIRYCERTLFYFNETRDVTFSTVVGQQWYAAAANANIPTLVRITAAYITDTGGNTLDMRRTTPEHIELLQDTAVPTGMPVLWTYFQQQIRLYPIPNIVYTVRLQLGPYRLAPLTVPTSTNAWLDEAYDMVKARAKYILWKNTLQDPNMALESLNDYRDQHSALKAETSRRTATNFIVPTDF